MESIIIEAEKRGFLGKKGTNFLRKNDKVPCVVYGKSGVIHFSLNQKDFKDIVYTPEVKFVNLKLQDGLIINSILQDIQFHPVSDMILHADFIELNDNKKVTMDIPIKIVGRSKGVALGGVLRVNMRKLKIKSYPSKLPDNILIDIENLGIGDKLYISSLKNDDYTFLHPDNAVVLAIRTSRNAVKEEIKSDT